MNSKSISSDTILYDCITTRFNVILNKWEEINFSLSSLKHPDPLIQNYDEFEKKYFISSSENENDEGDTEDKEFLIKEKDSCNNNLAYKEDFKSCSVSVSATDTTGVSFKKRDLTARKNEKINTKLDNIISMKGKYPLMRSLFNQHIQLSLKAIL